MFLIWIKIVIQIQILVINFIFQWKFQYGCSGFCSTPRSRIKAFFYRQSGSKWFGKFVLNSFYQTALKLTLKLLDGKSYSSFTHSPSRAGKSSGTLQRLLQSIHHVSQRKNAERKFIEEWLRRLRQWRQWRKQQWSRHCWTM